MDLAVEVLGEDYELREALKDHIRDTLEAALGFTRDDDSDSSAP